MHRLVSSAVAPLLLLLAGIAVLGCTGSPIGDPCVPESIPPGGFDSSEMYLETSSVQCRTRVCMVYRLDGNPENVCPPPPAPPTPDCLDSDVVSNQVYCSCRCSVPTGSQANTPTCDCADGFACIDDIVTTGGTGVQGGYCVPCITEDDPRGLDVTTFDICPTG